MRYFTIQARNHREAIERMKREYGEDSKILTYRNIRMGGIFGFFSKEGVELTGYVPGEEKPKSSLEENKLKILEVAKREQTLNYILKEIKELKENISQSKVFPSKTHNTIERLRQILWQNDFSMEYTDAILDKVKKEFSLNELDFYQKVSDRVVELIAESLEHEYQPPLDVKPRIIIIVGPTGVGKTTTLAKLAALYGLVNDRKNPPKIRLVTIDCYRIGAQKQIEIYGEIMRLPVATAETKADLKKILALALDDDLVLIDTIGESQRDYKKLAEMKEVLEAAGQKGEVFLTVSATTKTRDLEEIFQQYELFGYKGIILTKLDETNQIGNIISVVTKKKKPIVYLTDGQKVPQDISEFNVLKLLVYLEDLRIKREALEKKYPLKQAGLRIKPNSN